jgi:YVTN family beta-propeller protein
MLIALALLLQAGTPRPAPSAPQRPLPDPGVIAVEQRVTPAGVQSVFRGKVGGVRFGRAPGELWVAVPGAAYRVSWRDNRVVASSAFDGSAGVHGVAIDPATGRAIVSSVGRLAGNAALSRTPGSGPLTANAAVAHVVAYAGDSTVRRADSAEPDSAPIRVSSPALGDYMAGGPAIAARANAGGRRVMVVPLPANDALAVLDADDGSLVHTVPLGVLPVSAVVSTDGSTAWVSVLGGTKPRSGERAAKQCCDPRAEAVRVDARGIAARGNVTRVDLVTGRVTAIVTVGLHPTGVAWDESRGRLYVANGNSDDVSVVDTRANAVAATIRADPFKQRRIGIAPTAVALSPDGRQLYVTLGGANAVAIYDVAASPARLRGLVPTGWYPSSIDVSADGRTLAVGTLLGLGSGAGSTGGQRARYVHAVRGSVNVIDLPSDAELAAYTTSVAQNNRRVLASASESAPSAVPRAGVAARPVPERPGEPTPIQHVVFIIRENRTYDQVLGGIGKGASDSSLVMYGPDVTPNTHALANRYVLLDHFFASGGNSADGHNWLTQANETEYPMWPLYQGRSYPSEGIDPLAYSSGGFLWEGVQAKGKTALVFGEYAPSVQKPSVTRRSALLAQYRDSQPHDPAFFRGLLKRIYDTRSDIRSLDRILVREYPGWTEEIPDVVKADVVIDHLREWEARKAMPNLVMIILPSDHTVGTSPGWCTPKACVADNDLALGRIVDALSHSTFWRSMAILSVEDDAQDGVDHVDGHRTVALVASPYARRGVIDSTYYAQPSMVKTIELMLGLPAMSAFDLVATDMRASFIGPGEQPDFTPYTAIVPRQSLYDVNVRVGEITGPDAAARRTAALASRRMRFDIPDAAPSERLNRILWHDARGWRTPYPAVKQSLFFPMSISIADEDRDEVKEKEER